MVLIPLQVGAYPLHCPFSLHRRLRFPCRRYPSSHSNITNVPKVNLFLRTLTLPCFGSPRLSQVIADRKIIPTKLSYRGYRNNKPCSYYSNND